MFTRISSLHCVRLTYTFTHTSRVCRAVKSWFMQIKPVAEDYLSRKRESWEYKTFIGFVSHSYELGGLFFEDFFFSSLFIRWAYTHKPRNYVQVVPSHYQFILVYSEPTAIQYYIFWTRIPCKMMAKLRRCSTCFPLLWVNMYTTLSKYYLILNV